MYICNLNASNFRTSELRALNIEYFHYVRGEAYNTVYNSFMLSPPFKNIFTIMIFYNNNNYDFAGYRNDVK